MKTILIAFTFMIFSSCGSHGIKGTASDRTGTNGATNGTGKISKAL